MVCVTWEWEGGAVVRELLEILFRYHNVVSVVNWFQELEKRRNSYKRCKFLT